MAANPTFAATPGNAYVRVTAANTNRDGTGSIGTLVQGVVGGRMVERVRFKYEVTTTAGMARLFYSEDSGTTWRLIGETPVTAITASASVATFAGEFIDASGIKLVGTAQRLGVASNNAEAVGFFAAYLDP